jgi:hypothetical protein
MNGSVEPAMSSNPMSVESTLTRGTYIKLNLFPIFKTRGFCILMVIMAVGTFLLHRFDLRVILFIIWGIFSLIAVLVIIETLYMAFSTKNSQFLVPTRYTFDDEGISADKGLIQVRAAWNSIVEWKIVADHYVLFSSATVFIAIPRSSFSPDSLSRFKGLLPNIQKLSFTGPVIVETTLSRVYYIVLYLILFFYNISFFIIIVLYIGIYKFLIPTGFFNLLFRGLFVFYISYIIVSTLYHAYSPKNRALFLPSRYTFDEEKVLIEAGDSTTTVEWDAFTAWRALLGRYFLFLSSRKVIVIPQSKIPAQTGSAFEWLLHEKIGKKYLVIW